MNNHVLKYLAKTIRSNVKNTSSNVYRILRIADTIEHSVCKNTISMGFSKSIHKSHKAEYFKTVIYTLEQILRSINSRTWDIKSAIEWNKFTNGAY